MTLFNLQNQIAVKAVALLTILMMVLTLVPASVFAQAEGETPTEPAAAEEAVDSEPADNEEDIEDEVNENENSEILSEESENLGARFINIPNPKKWICHANNGDENDNGPFNYIEVNVAAYAGHAIQHDDDILPAFGIYGGKNLATVYPEFGGATGQDILDNECEIPYEETDDLIVITQSTVNLLTNPTGTGWYFESVAPFTAPFVFNSAAAKIGAGSLFAGPIGAVGQNKFIGAYQDITPVKNLKSFAYDFKIASNTAADENEFYLNVYANFGASSPTKFFDCRFDVVPSTGSLTNFTEVVFDANSTTNVANVAQSGSSPFTCPTTLAGMETLSPGSVVRAFALNIGDTGTQDTGVSGYFDKVVIKTQDDTNYTKNTTTFDFEPARKKDEVTVVATKLICEDESDLPNWGGGGQGPITAQTAADWVENSDGACEFASDWEFQYADQSGPDTAGDFIGESDDYTTFDDTTDINGVTTQTILLNKGVTELHLREVLQEGYIPFSKDNEDDVSAEFYCANDVLNYDNWDFIRNPEAGTTYYCVAWNVETEKPQQPVCEIGKNLLQNGSFEVTPVVTDNGGQWQIFAAISDWFVGLSDGIEVWNTFNGVSDDAASDGLQNVELDGNNATRLTQSATTIPGATYELKFDFSPRATIGAADNMMAVLVDGATVDTVNGDGTGTTTNSWTPQSQTFVAASTSTEIGFEDIGAANDNGGYGPLLDNVALCLVKEPEPLPTCSLTIKSDLMDYVVEKNAMAQTLSTINGAWVPTLGTSTAAWIWGDNPVVDATVAETQTFKKGFNWTGGAVTSATLKVSSDNTHTVDLGAFTVTDNGEFNYGPADISTYNVAAGITAGANTLEIAVGNIPVAGSTAVDNPAGLMYELTITGTGESCGTIVPEVPKTTGTVTMCKVDENNLPLSGWTMTLLGDDVDSVVVPAGNAAGVNTTAILNAGKSYVAVAQGTWNNNRGPLNVVDAEYSTEDSWATQMDGFTGFPTDILELSINNVLDPQSKWGPYNSDHTYAQMFTQAATGTAKFHIADTFYGDNTGNLNVTVFEGYAGITGENGCVTFSNVPFGTYDADEILKAGWTQVSGAGSTTVSYENTPKTITIKNDKKDIVVEPKTYVLDGYKRGCVEDGSYYCEEGLANWTITATKGSTTLSTTTDASGYYSFVVGEGNWTVSETMKPDWTQVEIDAYGGEVAGQTCTFTVRDNSLLKRVVSLLSKYSDYQCDFGNYYEEDDNTPRTYTITGVKWNDVDGDGFKEEGEANLPNWTIKAVKGSTTISTTTNGTGNYTLILPYESGVWVISETLQSGWTQTGRYQNGVKVTLGGEVSNNCSFNLGAYVPTATCDFGNQQNAVVVDEPETPRRSGGGGSGTRVTNRATPQGLVLGAATGTPACGMYLQDYMRMGNAASTTQVTKLQVFLNAVGITAPLTGVFDAATDAAVRAFQMQYKPEVLTPWYLAKLVPHENSTGWVYQLTRWKINNIVCPGSEAYPVLN